MTRREFLALTAAVTVAPRFAAGAAASAPIPRRKLGRTGEAVSALGLGGFHIGKQQDEQESLRIIRAAVDAGVTFLDNCWDYNDGQSEIRMGKALRDGYRGKVFLMTKIDGRDRATAAKQIDESLRRLQTDRLDLLQLHEVIRPTDPAKAFGPAGAIEAMVAARQAGKVRFLGFTGHKSPDIHLAMLRTADQHGFSFDAVQMPLNVLDAHHDSFEKKVLPVLLQKGIGVLGMKPLGSGLILEAKAASAEECLRYAMSLPVSVTITGIDSMEVLGQDLRIARGFTPMREAQVEALLARTSKAAGAGAWEKYKTTHAFDGTYQNPQWLGA
jgi:aryl-alcohol dehydrogenase-like predicted oxidoreductase